MKPLEQIKTGIENCENLQIKKVYVPAEWGFDGLMLANNIQINSHNNVNIIEYCDENDNCLHRQIVAKFN